MLVGSFNFKGVGRMDFCINGIIKKSHVREDGVKVIADCSLSSISMVPKSGNPQTYPIIYLKDKKE